MPYPYADPDTVTSTDLSWLEHRLLFFFKQPADYGAKLTNGIIYTMKFVGEASDKRLLHRPKPVQK